MIVWKVDRADLLNETKITLNFVSIMNEEDDESEENEKHVPDIREKTENYLKKTVKTEADSNYIITDEILVNILEEFMEKNRINRKLFKIQNIDQRDVVLSVYAPGENLKKEENLDMEEKSDLREILIMAIKNEYYYIVVDEECDRKYSGLYVRKAPLSSELTEEYLKNHKVILFPFNREVYPLLRRWFLNATISDSTDIENAGKEREQKFWDYVLNNPAWERAVQWTMKHGIKKNSFQQRSTVTEQYKELCKEFWRAYIDYCKKKKDGRHVITKFFS